MHTENNVSSVSIFTFFSVTLCMVFGVIGNVMVLCYYTQFVHKGFLRVLVIAMASLDLLSCLTLMPLQIYLTSVTYKFRTPSEETCQAFWGLQMFVVCACAWLLASWTYEMQRKVLMPFSQSTIDQRRVLLEVAGAVTVAITASIPAVLLSGVTSHADYLQNPHMIAVCFVAQSFLGKPWVLVYHGTIAIYLIGVTCFIITANMRISSAVFRVSDSNCSLGFTVSKGSLSQTARPPPAAHSSIQIPTSPGEFILSERPLTPEATTHPVKLTTKSEPSLRELVSAPKEPPSSLSLPLPPRSQEDVKKIGDISRRHDSSLMAADFYQKDRSRRPKLSSDLVTLQQVRSSACCTLCLMSLLVVVQFLPFAIFILDTTAKGSAGVKRVLSTNTSVVLQLIYRSFFIGCAVNSYVLFVSDKRFRLYLTRFQLQIRDRENPKFLRALFAGRE